MAFSQLYSAQVFNGNNSVTITYPVTFPVVSPTHLYVSVQLEDEEEPTLLDAAEFVIHESGGSYSIATVVAVPITGLVTVFRQVPLDQPFQFPNGGPFPTEEVERAMDRMLMQIQQVARVAGAAAGSIIVPGLGTEVMAVAVFADAAARALAVPAYVGQPAVQLDTQEIWLGEALTAGAWGLFVSAPVVPVALPAYAMIAALADTGSPDIGGIVDFGTMIQGRDPDAVLLSGDNNYGTPPYIAANNAPLNWALGKLYTAEGNHDLDNDAGVSNRAYFVRPASPAGLPGCYVKTLAGGLVDLIVLSSGRNTAWTQTVTGGVAVGSPMHAWFLSLLPNLTAPHRVVMFHHPEFTPVTGAHECEPDLAWPWWEYGVTAVINGHSHLTWAGRKRGVLYLNPSATCRQDGVLGAVLQGAGSGAYIEFAEQFGYCICLLHVTPESFQYEFVDDAGITRFAGAAARPQPPYAPDVYPLGDVFADAEALAVGTRYADHLAADFRLDAVRLSVAVPAVGDGYASVNVKVDGNVLFEDGVLLSAGYATVLVPQVEFTGGLPTSLLAGAKLEVDVPEVSTGYDIPPLGLRVALIGKWSPRVS